MKLARSRYPALLVTHVFDDSSKFYRVSKDLGLQLLAMSNSKLVFKNILSIWINIYYEWMAHERIQNVI